MPPVHHWHTFFVNTSTPRQRRKSARSSDKFTSIGAISMIETPSVTTTQKSNARSVPISNQLGEQMRRLTQNIQWTAVKPIITTSESSPDYDSVHYNSTKMVSFRKSGTSRRRRNAQKAKKSFRSVRREQRIAVYNKGRIMEPSTLSNATYDIANSTKSTNMMNESELENDEINDFFAEVKRFNGFSNITFDNQFVDKISDKNGNFEQLCHQKSSEHPYVERTPVKKASYVLLNKSESLNITKSIENPYWQQLTPNSIATNGSPTTAMRSSGHCARTFWNQHKIPQIVKYKAEKRRSQSPCNQSTDCLQTIQQALWIACQPVKLKFIEEWNKTPALVKFYLIAITFCFISILLK